MKEWIIGILGIVVMNVLAEIVLSDSQIGNFAKKIFAVASVLMILYPVKNLFNVDINKFFNYQYEQDDDYMEYVQLSQKQYLEFITEKTLFENGFENVKVEISYNLSQNENVIEKVVVNLENLVINNNVAHINKYEEIKKIVSVTMSVKEDIIVLNE